MKRLRFFQSLPFSVWWIAILSCTAVFIFLSFCVCKNKLETIDQMQSSLSRIKQKVILSSVLKEKEDLFINQLKESDPYYLYHELENFVPLSQEILSLENLSDYVKQDKALQTRLNFLASANRFVFQEDAIRKENDIQEVEEKQKNPVEIDERDLQELLCKLEGISIPGIKKAPGRPQIVIKDFRLERKEHSSKDTYQLTMQIIKREKIKK